MSVSTGEKQVFNTYTYNVTTEKLSHLLYWFVGWGPFVHCENCSIFCQDFESLRRNVLTALGQLQEELQRSDTRVHCCVTGTLVLLQSLPPKLNPVIRPLMDCLKLESDPLLQVLYAVF